LKLIAELVLLDSSKTERIQKIRVLRLKAMMILVEVFWVLAPCIVVVRYRRFRGPVIHPEDGGIMEF
jgi:hypothetical protein